MKMRNAMMLLLATATSTAGCLSTDHTVSGTWSSARVGGCSDTFFYSDTVYLKVSELSPPVVLATAAYSCSDRAFEVAIPANVDAIRIEASAYAIGDSREQLSSGTATLDVPGIVDDVDVGMLTFVLP
jgi:hypothetical protein